MVNLDQDSKTNLVLERNQSHLSHPHQGQKEMFLRFYMKD